MATASSSTEEKRDGTPLWHPFANMATVDGAELVIERGEGVWLYDTEGKRYLDGSASLWYANVGHGRTEIADAVAAQLRELEAYSIFGDLASPTAVELARRLSDYSPMEDAKVFLTTGGGEAIDTAAKIVRSYWTATGHPNRHHLIGRIGGYHGTNGFGTSVGGIEANRAGFGTLIPHASHVAFDSVDSLERELQRVGPENVGAFFMEPILGAGGVQLPPEGYIEGVAELCASTGVLLVVDAVICGFGRLGTWYGIERWDVQPDLITFAKGVSSGYQPVGGVVASWDVAEPFFTGPGYMLRHGATYSGHAACAAGALANLDIIERENLLVRGKELEGDLEAQLRPLEDHPLVREVRAGIGLMAAVDLSATQLVPALAAELRERGVFARGLGTGVAFSPPLTIGTEELELIGTTMAESLDAILASAPATVAAEASR
jgi:adenosylmethionine-8-amino-7-oxononanoate aminotransferase